jgi:hypothetical protein
MDGAGITDLVCFLLPFRQLFPIRQTLLLRGSSWHHHHDGAVQSPFDPEQPISELSSKNILRALHTSSDHNSRMDERWQPVRAVSAQAASQFRCGVLLVPRVDVLFRKSMDRSWKTL